MDRFADFTQHHILRRVWLVKGGYSEKGRNEGREELMVLFFVCMFL